MQPIIHINSNGVFVPGQFVTLAREFDRRRVTLHMQPGAPAAPRPVWPREKPMTRKDNVQ